MAAMIHSKENVLVEKVFELLEKAIVEISSSRVIHKSHSPLIIH